MRWRSFKGKEREGGGCGSRLREMCQKSGGYKDEVKGDDLGLRTRIREPYIGEMERVCMRELDERKQW